MADPTAAAARERIGLVLKERWQLEEVLGIGGMAAVYAALHRNGAHAAIKILHGAISEDAVVRERFLREAYLANSVAHRGTVHVLDDDYDQRVGPFIVMELLDGAGVLEMLENGVVFDVPQALDIADQTLDVLAAAHARGIIHRDLKPANLFLCRDGTVKVLDFGIARLLEENAQRLTRTGVPIGTPAYMAPEQARGMGRDVDGRADVYAMGATLFRVLTGRHVHVGKGAEQIAKVAMQRAPKIGSVMPGLPADVGLIIDRSLEFEPARRYNDAKQMQADVRAVRKGQKPPVASVLLPEAPAVPALPPLTPRRRPPAPGQSQPPPSEPNEIFTQLAESAREAARAQAQKPDAFRVEHTPRPPGSGLRTSDGEELDEDDMPTQVASRPEMELGPRPLVAAFAQLRSTKNKPPPLPRGATPPSSSAAAFARLPNVPVPERASQPTIDAPTLALGPPPSSGSAPVSSRTAPISPRIDDSPASAAPPSSGPTVRHPSPGNPGMPVALAPASVPPADLAAQASSHAPLAPAPTEPTSAPRRVLPLLGVALLFFAVGVGLTLVLLRYLRG